MSVQTKTILKLKEPLTNADGSEAKDAGSLNLSQKEIFEMKPDDMKKWPSLTMGSTLLGLINSKKNLESIEQISKLQALSAKINNKMKTDKGEWHIEKQELMDLEELFKSADPKTLNVNLHGQVYNKIKDLLIQATA